VNHIKKGQKDTSPPSTTCMTCFDTSFCVENTLGSLISRPTHPSSMILSKTTCHASPGGNHHPVPHSVSASELESSTHTRNKCHTAQKQTIMSTGLESSPVKSLKRVLFTQADIDEVSEWFRKWMAARQLGAQGVLTCLRVENPSGAPVRYD